MKFCRFCGNQLPGRDIKFCPRCGKNIQIQVKKQVNASPQTRPPRIAKEKYIQPQPIRRVNKPHRPQVQTHIPVVRQRKQKEQVEKKVKISKGQHLTIFNQRIKASLERLTDSNSNLNHRESYQLSDHSNLILKLDELFTHQKSPLYEESDFIEATEEIIEETRKVLIRISEFLTSHLQTYGLDKIRKQWYELKEKQNHLELDRHRLTSLNTISEKLEKNFNILSYRLDDAKSVKMERSIFFGTYPQVHHYYFTELEKIIPDYIELIHASGFYQYYRNEVRILQKVQQYFTSSKYPIVDPQEVYYSSTDYLSRRNKVGKKLEIKLIEIQRQIIINQDLIRELRIRYIDAMEKVIENTPHDILLMKDVVDEHKDLKTSSESQSILEKGFNEDLELITPIGQLSSLNHLSNLGDFDTMNQLDKLDKLGAIKKLEELSKSSE
ncbi:MAG: zinc ribbon domain-containing protein [Candidatus Heimdallarchaeota archaeon]|nr:zinc ribbon domain-containing protein [Candidatus Heimdallarchaeota archaeon]